MIDPERLFSAFELPEVEEGDIFAELQKTQTFLKDYDPTSEQGKDAARIFADEYTITACDLAILFWEEREAYEKCAHIKKVQDFLKLNVTP
jgi:hypothetical protein